MKQNHSIILFNQQQIRRQWDAKKELWYFAIVDVISILTNSQNPQVYWRVLKKRLNDEGANETVTKCNALKMVAPDGKMRQTDVADTETLLRLIQSIPSPKAEPFKLWLARVGYERIKEIEDPELATKRTRALYKAKGYPHDWIEKRMRGIAIREELTDEWQNRGARKRKDYEILTAEISQATFGLKPSQYKKLKGLKRENLRDHMNDLELIFTMLGERATTEITRTDDSHGMPKLKADAKTGGDIAGGARKQLEKRTHQPVVTPENYLPKAKVNKLTSG